MRSTPGALPPLRSLLIWSAVAAAIAVPIAFAAASPLLAWRRPVYITGCFAGIIALGLVLVQPLLIASVLPGLHAPRGRHVHRWIGALLVAAILIHVGALWITSPPDMLDALLFRSPTPFSSWGVTAMWASLAAALLAALRRRMRLKPQTWRVGHTSLAVVIVAGSVVHALLVEGTMEVRSKIALCALVVGALLTAIAKTRVLGRR